MFLSVIGFVVAVVIVGKLLLWLIALIVNTFYNYEENIRGKQLIERLDDADINRTVTDALAAFGPGNRHLIAGAIATVAAVLSVPFFHWLYALWVRFIMTFSDSPVDRQEVYLESMQKILSYMPRVGINAVVLIAVGVYYAIVRRRQLQEDKLSRFLHLPATEVFGVVYGWILYLVAAVLPRFGPDGTYNFAGLITLGGGWVWIFSGMLVSMYLRAGQNALLWTMYRYSWSEAIPAVVRMMTLRRLNLPASVVESVVVDEPNGAATIRAAIDPIDADRLRDSLLAISGMHYPKVIALGPPVGAPVRISTQLPPRMRPLPPRAFRRSEGPPKGYGAEMNLLEEIAAVPDGNVQLVKEAAQEFDKDERT